MSHISYFWTSILYWYGLNKRVFPWRKTKDPYNILLAEVLLQKTNVRKVEDVYGQLLDKYPSPWELKRADLDEIRQIILPIGLIYRAERLIKTAELLCVKHGGTVPNESAALLSLPGVGDYIADAVLCYAYNRPTVPIDTNVIRLFTRYFGLISLKSRARSDKKVAKKIGDSFVFYSTRTANLAVLDFASTVCMARSYRCYDCILRCRCAGMRST